MKQKENASIKDFLIVTLVSIATVLVIRTYVAQPFVVSGSSMEPTFNTGEYLVVDQLSYRFNDPQRGDVIVFRYPEIPSKFFIKRIIGLPNESIKIEGDEIFIENDSHDFKKITEPYIEYTKNDFMEVTLDSDEYFVMGDNRLASLDSRSWGPLEKKYIMGRAFFRLFPINTLDVFPGK